MKQKTNNQIPVYEIGISIRVGWQAHSLSNTGNGGTNRTLPRRQLLADGTETDACSGSIAKRYHAILLAEQMEALGISLCSACSQRDGRRAAALHEINLSMDTILSCGLCDAHGFLVTAKKANGDNEARQRLSKHSLIEFTFALALPEMSVESPQLFTRAAGSDGEGQMLMKKYGRSGEYAQCIRYKAVGIGVDTDLWHLVVTDDAERGRRHQAIIQTLHDQLLSPSGALTSTMLPHLTGMMGVVAVKTKAGRAPLYSPLQSDFIDQLQHLENATCQIFPFHTATEFSNIMQSLSTNSYPCSPLQKLIASPE